MAVSVPAQYQGWVNTAARGTGLPASVVAAQINEESGFNPNATSPTGAQGIAQFEPGTWKSQGVAGSPYNPSAALQGYVKLMGALLHQYGGNVRNALAAYNAGSGNLGAGMGYANTILSNAGHGAGISVTPGTSSTPASIPASSPGSVSSVMPITEQIFNKAGFDQAQAKFIAGRAVSESLGSSNPFNVSPGGTRGFASSLGPTSASQSPLFGKGLLTTTAPNQADYETTKTINVAQSELQKLAGTTPLAAHPVVAASSGAPTQEAANLVSYAKAHAPGTSGECLKLVQDYLQATHSPGAGVPRFAYAHQFGDWLNQGNNAASVGLQKLNITNPYQAPPGAIVVVPYGAPGTSMPGAGDISIAAGNGQFVNDHLNESYGGSAAAWNASGAHVVGIYVPIH